jgi:serine acetyltransferase
MRQTFPATRRLIRADIEWRCLYEHKTMTSLTALRLMFHPGVATVLLFRWQRFFDDHRLGLLGSVCRWLNLVLFTSVFASDSEVAGGFLVVHAVANFIDRGVVIGPRCVFYSHNNLSRSPFEGHSGGAPRVDGGVVFGVGGSAHGNIRIGRDCRIGMNTTVDFSTEPGSTLLGMPPRVSFQIDAGPAAD